MFTGVKHGFLINLESEGTYISTDANKYAYVSITRTEDLFHELTFKILLKNTSLLLCPFTLSVKPFG